jgi:hypothetical protein
VRSAVSARFLAFMVLVSEGAQVAEQIENSDLVSYCTRLSFRE